MVAMPLAGIERLYGQISRGKDPVHRLRGVAIGSGLLVCMLCMAVLAFYQYKNYLTAVKIQNAFMEQYLDLVKNKLEDYETKAKGLQAILEVLNEQNPYAKDFDIHIHSSVVWSDLPKLLKLKNNIFSAPPADTGGHADNVNHWSASPALLITHQAQKNKPRPSPMLELTLPLAKTVSTNPETSSPEKQVLGMLHLGLNTDTLQQTLELMERTTRFGVRLKFHDRQDESFELSSQNYFQDAESVLSPNFPVAVRELDMFGGRFELEMKASTDIMRIAGFSMQALLGKMLACAVAGILSWLVLIYSFDRWFVRQRLSLLDELEKTNIDLMDQTQRLDASKRNSEDFIGILSHEIRNPLLTLKQIQTELNQVELSDNIQRLVSIQNSAVNTALDTLNNMLDLKKMELSALQLEVINFEPLLVFDEIRSMISVQSRTKRIALNINLDRAIPPAIKGDPLRLKQVLLNLMSNAVKFTEAGGKVELAVTAVSAGPGFVKLNFRISDSGKGIEKHMISRLLEAYEQADSSIARQYGGTGLGLNIASRIIHLMGGKLAIESKPGAGSVFSFELEFDWPDQDYSRDMRLADADKDRRLNALQQEFDPTTPKLKLLYVDDNEFNLMVAEELNKKSGHQLFLFTSPLDALIFMRTFSEGIDIVLSDLHMPEMSGPQFAMNVRQGRFGDQVFLAGITASLNYDMDSPGIQQFDGVFPKPFDLKKILKKFEEFRTEEKLS
jgi:signal transduction histidine kinase/CheY-like chemotaxis protein